MSATSDVAGKMGGRAMNRLRSPRMALTGMAVSVVLSAGGLSAASAGGSSASSRAPNGRKLFIANCASCHTLRAAGAAGTDGGNLDSVFRHTKRTTIGRIVARAIRNGADGMPAGILVGGDANAVAVYVASVAGKPPPGPKHCTPGKRCTPAKHR
jgi:mono/diheme cytochrome c family protein